MKITMLTLTKDFIKDSLIFIFSAIGLVGSYLVGLPLLATVSAITLFTSFDVIGYFRMGTHSNKEILPYYEGNPHNQMTNRCKQCGNPCKKKSVYCSRQCAGRGNNRNSKVK